MYRMIVVIWVIALSSAWADVTKPVIAPEMRTKLYNESNLPSTGPADAKMVMVDFFDYNCPFCRKMHWVVSHAEKCDPKLRIVYRHLPLLGPDSKILAKAALAAERQNRFRDMHEWLMTSGYDSKKDDVLEQAKEMGLNSEQFARDIESPELEKVIDHTIEFALKLNMRTVPAIILGNYLIRESMDQDDFVKIMRQAYTEASAKVPSACF